MSLDDPRSYLSYDEDIEIVSARLEFPLNVERLQDEMRRVKEEVSFQVYADLIPQTVEKYASRYPSGGDVSSQNLYDFLKVKSPSTPGIKRRLAFHAFMMVVDQTYREKWDDTHFVRRAGLTLTEFFATDRTSDPYCHSLNRQSAAGLYIYQFDEMMLSTISKPGFQYRGLLLHAPEDQPFLLAYDFDVLDTSEGTELDATDFTARQVEHIQNSWDLDARVGFYIPKRSRDEGIILLNSYKWDWPSVYGSMLNYPREPLVDYDAPDVSDILLTDVNSLLNIPRSEKIYMSSDYQVPDERKLIAARHASETQTIAQLTDLFDRKFDWGADL